MLHEVKGTGACRCSKNYAKVLIVVADLVLFYQTWSDVGAPSLTVTEVTEAVKIL